MFKPGLPNVKVVMLLVKALCIQVVFISHTQIATLSPAHGAGTSDSLSNPVVSSPPLEDVVDLAAGESHTCAVTRQGTVRCWGYTLPFEGDAEPAIGLEHTPDSLRTPIEVAGITDAISVFASPASDELSCALTRRNEIKCWNTARMLSSRRLPISFTFATEVASVSVGPSLSAYRLCVVYKNGTVECNPSSRFQTKIPGLTDAIHAVSSSGMCAITKLGLVRCWNSSFNSNIQIEHLELQTLQTLRGVVSMFGDERSGCALLKSGQVRCWMPDWAALAISGKTQVAITEVPMKFQDVPKLTDAVAIAGTTGGYACAVTRSGRVQCWAEPTKLSRDLVTIKGIDDATTITAGKHHVCVLTRAGRVKCFGSGVYGQLGPQFPTPLHYTTPQLVADLKQVAKLVGHDNDTCALTRRGAAYCWGAPGREAFSLQRIMNSLSRQTPHNRSQPILLEQLLSSRDIALGKELLCAVTNASDHPVKCIGELRGDMQGSSTHVSAILEPANVVNLTNVTSITAYSHTACATTDKGIWCWGGAGGLRRAGTAVGLDVTPVQFVNTRELTAVTPAGEGLVCGATRDGIIYCESLVVGYALNHYSKARANELAKTTHIAFGSEHGCALTQEGKVLCWGSNEFGQLGDPTQPGSKEQRYVGGEFQPHKATQVINLEPVVSLAAGQHHTCAVTQNGRVKCWGRNQFGQLGDGTTQNRATPVEVKGLSNATAVVAGTVHTCALTKGGEVFCWGSNLGGRLGLGTLAYTSEPVEITLR